MDDREYAPAPGEGFDEFYSPRFRSRQYARRRPLRKERALGGLVVLSGFKNHQPKLRAVLDGAVVQKGRNAGAAVSQGLFSHDWDLDYDGRRAVFCWIHKRMPNLYVVNMDPNGAGASGMTQLTDTVWANFDPVWLPNGRIVFRSNRRFVIDRCQPWDHENYSRRHCSTLFSMKADGSDATQLSWHETNEAHPSVDNDGRLVYTRWDYIDRGFNAAQHVWHCFPDGRDPRSMHGNYPLPHFRGEKRPDGPTLRSCGEFHARAIPGTKGKYVLIDGGITRSCRAVPSSWTSTWKTTPTALKCAESWTLTSAPTGNEAPVSSLRGR